MTALGNGYRRDIDGLRAIAVSIVVIFHAWPGVLPGGFVGVDVFFVISGFLISSVIMQRLDAGRFTFREFYVARARRIFPALACTLGVSLVVGWFTLSAPEYRMLGKHVLASAFFAGNVQLFRETGYFDVASDLKPLLHLWSLGVEEQFYAVWPPCLLLAWRHFGTAGRARFVYLALLTSLAACILLTPTSPSASFYLPGTRVWELLMGAMLATPGLQGPTAFRGWGSALAGVGILALSAMFIVPGTEFPGWRALFPCLGSALLIWSGDSNLVSGRVLASAPFRFIGRISYPLYLWHWPILAWSRILQRTGETSPVASPAACVAASLVLAWLTFRFIETPVRRDGMAADLIRRTVCVLVAAVSFLGVLGGAVFLADGSPSRIPRGDVDDSTRKLFDHNAPEGHPDACRRNVLNIELCTIGNPDAPVDTALIGDSHASQYSQAYRARWAGNVVSLGRSGVPPLLRIRSNRTPPQTNNDVLDWVVRHESVKTVILAAFWENYFREEGAWVGGSWYKNVISDEEDLAEKRQDVILVRGLKRTVDALLAAQKRVVIWLDIPHLTFPLSGCVTRPPFLGSSVLQCEIPRQQVDASSAGYRAAFAAALVAFPQVEVVDPTPFLCDDRSCTVLRGGTYLYGDDHHLSIVGADAVLRDHLAGRRGAAP